MTFLLLKQTLFGSDIRLSPVRRHAINWTNTDPFLIDPLEINGIKIWTKVDKFSLIHEYEFEILSTKWQPYCLDRNI